METCAHGQMTVFDMLEADLRSGSISVNSLIGGSCSGRHDSPLMPQRTSTLSRSMLPLAIAALLCAVVNVSLTSSAYAIDGGTLRVNPRNDWLAFEVISIGDNPASDGFSWAMPGNFDGLGAWRPNSSTLRLQVNHEISDATISEVDLNLTSYHVALLLSPDGGSQRMQIYHWGERQRRQRRCVD